MLRISALAILGLGLNVGLAFAVGSSAHARGHHRENAPIPLKIFGVKLKAVEPAASATPFPSVLTRKYDGNQINSCIESVCGPADKNWGSYDTDTKRREPSRLYKRLWDEEYERKIRRTLELEIETDSRQADQLIPVLRRGFSLSAAEREAFKAFYGVLSSFSGMATPAGQSLTYDEGNIELDEVKFDSLTKDIPLAERAAYKVIAREFYLPLVQVGSLTTPFDNTLKARLQMRYPGVPLQDALKGDAARLLETILALRNIYGTTLSSVIPSDLQKLLEKAKAGNDLTKLESEYYVEQSFALDLFSLAVDTRFKPIFIAAAVKFDDAASAGLIDGTAEKFIKVLKNKNKNRLERTLTSCRDRFANVMEMNEGNVRNTRRLINEVRAASKKVIRNFAADQADLQKLEKEIDEIQFQIVDNAVERLRGLRQLVHRNLRTELQHAQNTEGFDNLLILKFILQNAKSTPDDENEKHEIERKCEDLTQTSLTDAAYTVQGRIMVSWFTSVTPETGLSILAHEVGHVVSRRLRSRADMGVSTARFEKSLTCVANRNPFVVKPKKLTAEQNTTWSEEDWADHFSALVINQLVADRSLAGKRSKNLGCALVQDFGIVYFGDEIEPSANDSHSSSFLRLLLHGYDRGHLTPQCQPFLEYAKKRKRPLRCS